MQTTVLVEGLSDLMAVTTLAQRQGRDLDAEGVHVVQMGGATNIGAYLNDFGPSVRITGLCDVGEESHFRRALERAGAGDDLDREAMEELGFFVCVEDLEDELIRALGALAVEKVIKAQGELGAFRTLQKQAPWRDRPTEEQLRRWLGSGARRKIRYGSLLVEALDLDQIPRPLDKLLAHI